MVNLGNINSPSVRWAIGDTVGKNELGQEESIPTASQTFNGGTITNPLGITTVGMPFAVDETSGTISLLSLLSAGTQRLGVDKNGGISIYSAGATGNVSLYIEDASGNILLWIRPDTGAIRMPSLPTSDPMVTGQLWNDAGTLKISAG